MSDGLESLLEQIRACRLCEASMDRKPNPVLQAGSKARILIAGQAPGNLADLTGTPFNDPSGKRLRDWMQISETDFYDPERVAIVPMGFCFPGYSQQGADRPPMQVCAETWRDTLLADLPDIEVTLLVGLYAQAWHLGPGRKASLTETVRNWQAYASERIFTLPHPSWRNTSWLKRNPWFEEEVLPALRSAVSGALAR
ncbi:MAG: uracil-DNA glycosylase family protein [Hyphomonas sp.]|nr:uracil-DNA glycosylase family protein [Hyphomonas sp.]